MIIICISFMTGVCAFILLITVLGFGCLASGVSVVFVSEEDCVLLTLKWFIVRLLNPNGFSTN